IDLQRSFIPPELQSSVVYAADIRADVGHHEILRKLEGRGDRVGKFPDLDAVIMSSCDRGEGRRRSHVPLNHIDPMREQVGEHSAAEIPEMPPLEKALELERLI